MACNYIFQSSLISKLNVLGLPLLRCRLRHCFCGTRHIVSYSSSFQKYDEAVTAKSIGQKVIFNSKLSLKLWKSRNDTSTEDGSISEGKIERPPVLALKYFEERSDATVKNDQKSSDEILKNVINLPYKHFDNVDVQEKIIDSDTDESSKHNRNQIDPGSPVHEYENLAFSNVKDKNYLTLKKDWLKGYNKYPEICLKTAKEESKNEEEDELNDKIKFGSEDPSTPSSSIPCGGCGAYLHCQDASIPGFLPKEIFGGLSDTQLQGVVCQRCHFLQEYNTALSVNVDPQMYPQLLSQIKSQVALVILVVDMTDFPCSIWPGILDVIGPKRPLIVVGNKIDLLQDTKRDWLVRAKAALVKQLPPRANVLDVALISAKTGYGIEQLITSLYNLWEYRGDVYLVGCTNVGKSTLFNALLQSDYCKTKAVNLLQRATTAPWPGTTLNLLKFPIMRPQGWRLAMRSHRLKTDNTSELKKIQEGKTETTPQMISVINRTFSHGMTDKNTDEYFDDPFAMPKMATLRRLQPPNSGLDPNDPVFAKSKWLYDTPGVITPDQIIDLLTTEELMKTLAKEAIVPRSFTVWAGQSLLIAGLARVDYIKGDNNIKMTVLSSKSLPVTICFTQDVDEVYDYYLGSEVLAVPCGGAERLEQWPGLASAAPFVLKGEGWQQSCADVVLSSAGWIAVTALENCMAQLQAWTPDARGIHVRVPPVLPQAVLMKGRRLYKSQAYALYNENAKKKIGNR